MVNYKIVYRGKDKKLFKCSVPLPNIKSLAKYMNSFVKRNPDFFIVVCYIEDNKFDFYGTTHFLKSEYDSQRWLTGDKERLLANALEKGNMDLKWNSGLNKKGEQ